MGYQGTLVLGPDYWEIAYIDGDKQLQTIRWNLNRIVSNQTRSKLHTFKYGDFPQQVIECSDENFPETLSAQYPERHFYDPAYKYIFKNGYKAILAITLTLIGLVVLIYFFVLPFAAVFLAGQIPKNLEVEIGDALYENMISNFEINDTLTEQLNYFANEIDFNSEYDITITVVNKDELNAFALPGGHIVVFSEIIKEMKVKEELAALLSHEAAHIENRHSLKNIFRSLSSYLFFTFLFNDINGIASVIAENSNTIMNLSYSRELEMEADAKGLNTLERNKISEKGFVLLFERLQKEHDDMEAVKLLLTHPLTKERIATAKMAYKNQKGIVNNESLENIWQKIREQQTN